jgi:outer membrane lipoprotein carrier protein
MGAGLALSAVAAAGAVTASQQLPVDRLLDRVQEHYRGLTTLEARFEQIVEARPGMPPTVTGGRWLMRAPGRMRVEYADTGRLLVADGSRLYWYLPADRQVHVRQQDALSNRGSALLYLTGEGDLREDFAVAGTEWRTKLAPGNIQLRLDPLVDGTDYAYLLLEVDEATATIVRLVTFGPFGDVSEFRFYDVVGDVDLAEDLFQFTIPAGVEVETLGN